MQGTGRQEPQRIAKLLARAGVASRREIERMIAEGRVAIDGVRVETPATLLTSLRGVTVDGVAVKEAAPARLFLFHKPPGVLTAASDPMGRATIYDRLPRDLPRLMPVGRLDLNTEGLLLLTTDGEFKRQLELPATGVERAYRARAYGDVTQAQLEDLIEGVEIDGIRYGQIDANLERRTGANVWIEMVLTEGKNREVRRVLEHLGLQVSRLIRTRYGPFVLGDLPVGGVGEVRQVDLIQFRASLKGNKAKATEDARANPVAVRVAEPRAATKPPTDAAAPPRRGRAADAPRDTRDDAAPRRERPTPARQSTDRTPRDPQVPRDDRARPARPGHTAKPRPAVAAAGKSSGPVRPRRNAGPDERPATDRRGERSDRASATAGRGRSAAQPRPDRAASPDPKSRAPRDRGTETHEDITTRPRRAAAGPVTERPEAKPRPKRGVGWAKPKPKPGRSGPRKPRA